MIRITRPITTTFALIAPALGVLVSTLALCSTGCSKTGIKPSLPDMSFLRGGAKQASFEEAVQAENSKSTLNAADSGIVIWHDDYEAAVAASRASGKPILADFTGSDWCGWCIKLKKDVFQTESFQQWAAENVILLELDYPRRSSQPAAIKQQNADLKARYNIQGYPTVLLLTADGEKIGKLGYMKSPNDWILTASEQLGAANTRTASRFNPVQ